MRRIRVVVASVIVTASVLVASPTAGADEQFVGTIERIDQQTAKAMVGVSWHEGCPVKISALRAVSITYWGFDAKAHQGTLVVHRLAARSIVTVFKRLYRSRFPIASIEPIDRFGGNDDASTMANNTSAFNCRPVTAGKAWSQHAYGLAVDINPVQNPYVYRDGHVLDPAAAKYTDRSLGEPGMITAGDVVAKAFRSVGWRWGGRFIRTKDYQHFSATGR